MPSIKRNKGYTFKILGVLEIQNNTEKLQGLIDQRCYDVSQCSRKNPITHAMAMHLLQRPMH